MPNKLINLEEMPIPPRGAMGSQMLMIELIEKEYIMAVKKVREYEMDQHMYHYFQGIIESLEEIMQKCQPYWAVNVSHREGLL